MSSGESEASSLVMVQMSAAAEALSKRITADALLFPRSRRERNIASMFHDGRITETEARRMLAVVVKETR